MCDVVEVKSSVVDAKNEVMARVAEVKNDVQEVKCMRFVLASPPLRTEPSIQGHR